MGRPAKVAPGFTLLELIVTLAVLAIAVAVVTPTIGRGTESLRARAEVASFAATLRHAREQAITTQRTYRVAVDGENHRISVTTLPSPASLSSGGPASPSSAGSASASSTLREPEVNETRTLSPRLVVEAAQASEVVFDVHGGASGGDFKLTSGGVVYRVTVDRLSGRVRSVRE
jgi:type II secretion system protein H